MPAALTVNGLVIQTLAEIKAEMEAALQSEDIFGPDFDVTSTTPEAQFVGVLSERERKIQELIDVVNDAANPNDALKVELDNVSALFGTTRRAATKSTIVGKVLGTDTTPIPVGSQVRFTPNLTIWETTTAVVIGAGGTPGEEPVTVRAVLTGPTSASISTSWTIVTPVVGWDFFESTAAVVLGLNEETDAELRARRAEEVFTLGSSNFPAIIANVQQVAGVTSVTVFENRTDVAVAPLPPHSFELVVEGGADQDIANEVFNNKPAGIEVFGTEGPFTVTDATGKDFLVDHSRPTLITIFLNVFVTTTGAEDDFPVGGEALIEAALLTFAVANHDIGDDVIADFFNGTIYATVGNKSILSISMGIDDVAFIAGPTVSFGIAAREKATFDAVRIQVAQV